MLSKYEFWVNTSHSANDILHAWICSQDCRESTREKWTGNLINCFELGYSTQHLQCCEIVCQKSAETMISNYWEIVALDPTIEVMKWLSHVKCSCRN